MHDLVPILVVAIVMLTIYRMTELFARRSERMKIIEQATNVPELVNQLNLPILKCKAESSPRSVVLRISLLVMGIGAGLIFAFLIQNYLRETYFSQSNQDGNPEYINNYFNVLYPAFTCLFGGLGLLIAYLIEGKKK